MFGHVIGKAVEKWRCYCSLSITQCVQDNHLCAVNPRFVAVVTECTGGGAFLVIPINYCGRVSVPPALRVCVHSAPVLDVKFDPFDDQRIASCSEDSTVKICTIGLHSNLYSSGLSRHTHTLTHTLMHTRRVSIIEWHPNARDLLLSSAYDRKVCMWRLDSTGKSPVCVIDTHSALVMCVCFSADGSLFATASKDKKIRIIEPRSKRVLQESCCSRVHRVLFLCDLKMLLSTGVSQWNQRQFVLWDQEDLSSPLLEQDLDAGSGIIFPFYDADTHMLYLAGKGDGNIRYYMVSARKPYVQFLSEYRSLNPQRGLARSECQYVRNLQILSASDCQRSAGATELLPSTQRPLLISLRPQPKIPECLLTELAREPGNWDMDQPPDIILDLCDWTDDDTHSQDWIGDRNEQKSITNKVSHQHRVEIEDLREKLKQRDEKIEKLELELKNMRKYLRDTF
ncbi:hypothetical protein DNTS_009653 [Danionella cerebrum]|uniref:Coronin n=1 Tax=Danionella cerebrum TaxID=2873325 RepID=A0A553N4B7_9TELE|nr:hypothetical protein DNTS_009653 [Danionella translucida]